LLSIFSLFSRYFLVIYSLFTRYLLAIYALRHRIVHSDSVVDYQKSF